MNRKHINNLAKTMHWLVIAALALVSLNAGAATITSTAAGGNWNATGTWVGGVVPLSTDSVIIATTGAGQVAVNVQAAMVALTINSGSILNITGGSNFRIRPTGATSISGTLNFGTTTSSSRFTGLATITATGVWNNSGNQAIRFSGGLTNNGTFTGGTGTQTFNTTQTIGGGNAINFGGSVAVTGAITVTNNNTNAVSITGNLTGSVATSTWTNAANSTLNVNGTLLTTGVLNASATGNTVNYSGAAQAIKTPSAAGYYHLTLSGSGAKTAAANLLINGDLTLSGSATFTAGTSRTHTIAGNFVINTTAATPFTWTTTSIFNFNTPATPAATSIGGTTVATLAFNTVNINNTSGVNLNENASFSGTLTIAANATLTPAAAAVVSGTGTLTGTGTAAVTTLAAGGFNAQYTITTKTMTNLTVAYTGAGAQTVTVMTYGSATGGGLNINNASGASLTASTTVAGTLTLANGVVSTGAFTLITTGNCTTTVLRTSGWVAGNLQLNFPAGAPSCTYYVGDATIYRPIDQAFASVTVAGAMSGSVSQAAGEAPNIATSGLDSTKDVNRYWTITDPAGGTIVYTTYSATFTFVAADYDVGANPLNFEVEASLGGGAVWTTTTIGTRTATTDQATGIAVPSAANTFYNFAVGEKKALTPGAFNAYDTTTPAAAITGKLHTKIAGAAFSFDIIALNLARNAILTSFLGQVKVELLDASSGGALDANNCNAGWTLIQLLPNQTFIAGDAGRHTVSGIVENNAWRNVAARVSFPTVAPTAIGCSTDHFAIRPNNLTIVSVTDATWQTAGITRTLNNSGATGGNVHKAGQPFTISAAAYNAAGVPAITSNYAGSPTVGTLTCTLPAACTNGILTPGAWSASGGTVTTTTASYSEAGAFNLTLEDRTFATVDSGDGTAADCTTSGYYVCPSAAVSVGRFVPDHFDLAVLITPVFNTFGTACAATSFTYIGQPFNYTTAPQATIRARNAAGTTTANYSGTLWKIAGTSSSTKDCTTNPDICQFTSSWTTAGAGGNVSSVAESYTYALTPASTPNWDNASAATAAATVTAGSGASAGTGTIAVSSSDTLAFLRSTTTPQAIFTASITDTISVTDASEVGSPVITGNGTITTTTPLVFNGAGTGITFDSGNEFRYGRLKLSNAYGSELLDLPIPIQTQYWDSTIPAFVTNSADSCTSLTAVNITLGNYQGGISLANMDTPAGSHISLGGAFAVGLGNLTLFKPSPTPTSKGSTDVTVNLTAENKIYLQGAWTGATYNQNPSARATFGVYKGANEFIYLRENY